MTTAAIIVNYRSSDLILGAVRSVLESASLTSVRVVVVDNSAEASEADRLRKDLPSSVTLLINRENIGFGRACNLAFERFPADTILLINPDARLLPGCLKRMQETLLAHENTAAVSPQIYWDEALTFCLPPSCPPALLEFQASLHTFQAEFRLWRLLSLLWRYYALTIWSAQKPVRVRNLTGGLVLLKSQAVQKVGGLFDPRFFLYFEDTDLFVRLRKGGYTLAIEPRAKAIHNYDQCRTPDLREKRANMSKSRAIYLRKHPMRWVRHGRRISTHLFRVSSQQFTGSEQGQEYTAPFTIQVPPSLRRAWLFEWSPHRDFIPSAARWGEGPSMNFHQGYWTLLSPGLYFGRLGRPIPHETRFCRVSWRVDSSKRTGVGLFR